ncbi:MAG: MFS transporter, partial [Candidatus Thorarchaeota archaeon]
PFILYIPIPIYGISNFIAGIIFYRKVDESIKFSDENENNSDIISDEILYEKKRSRSMVMGTILLLILLFLSSINGNIARPFLNIYVIENIESNVNLVLWAYLPMGLVATLLAPKLGSFIDKLRPSIGISITWSLGSLLTWLLINATNIWVFSVILLFDLAIGMSAGLIFQNFYSRISTEHRGKIFGVGDLFAFLGNVIGPILGGMVWDLISPQFPFIISIFVELSLIPLYLTAVHLLIPHMAESYEFKKKEEVIPEFEL